MTFELGCSSVVYRTIGLQNALRRIKSLGFRVVDIGMLDPHFCPHFNPETASRREKDELKNLLEEMELRVSALNVHYAEHMISGGRLHVVSHGFLEDRDKQMIRTRRALDLAQALGAYTVTIQSARDILPNKWLEAAREVASGVAELALYAQDKGLDLTVENHLRSIVETSQQTIDFLTMVDRENVGIAFDSAHMAASGADPVKAVGELKDLIRHVHLKDTRNKNIHYSVGDGTIDFSEFLGELEKIGYLRAAVLEIQPKSKKLADVDREAWRSKNYLMKFFEAEGHRLVFSK